VPRWHLELLAPRDAPGRARWGGQLNGRSVDGSDVSERVGNEPARCQYAKARCIIEVRASIASRRRNEMGHKKKPNPLPERFRKTEPKFPETFGSLEIGQSLFISIEDLYIDNDWGVWIDPMQAVDPLKSMDGSFSGGTPFRLDRTSDGFDLVPAPDLAESFQKSKPRKSTKGLIQVNVVSGGR
jgi:hypothetical protein